VSGLAFVVHYMINDY